MTEAMPFLQKHDITFLRPPPIFRGLILLSRSVYRGEIFRAADAKDPQTYRVYFKDLW